MVTIIQAKINAYTTKINSLRNELNVCDVWIAHILSYHENILYLERNSLMYSMLFLVMLI